jgi:CRISPR-associated endonuclease/helicase Cas3
MIKIYYNFWGKAGVNGDYHCLPYHCLDVAAVGHILLVRNTGSGRDSLQS